jgi:predicted nucleic acid-binding Zn ribbon protein
MEPTISFQPMPTYVYKFLETGEVIEVQQSFHDDALTEAVHPASGTTMAVKKVFLPVGVTFKGDGFYKTDSRSGSKSSSSAAKSESSDAKSSDSKSSDSKSSDSKSSDSSSSSSSSDSGSGASSGSGSGSSEKPKASASTSSSSD